MVAKFGDSKMCQQVFEIIITIAKRYIIIFIIWRTWTLSGTDFCKIQNECLLVYVTYWETVQVIIISI